VAYEDMAIGDMWPRVAALYTLHHKKRDILFLTITFG